MSLIDTIWMPQSADENYANCWSIQNNQITQINYMGWGRTAAPTSKVVKQIK